MGCLYQRFQNLPDVYLKDSTKELVFEKDNLPKGWIITIIDKLSIKIHYGYTAKSTKANIGPKYLRITDIQNNTVNWDKVPYCQIPTKKISAFLLEANNLVFARTGATVGKSFLIKNPPNAVFASYLVRIVLSNNTYANYVSHFFKSDLYWQQIHSGNIGIAQPNFNANKLSKIKIPLPSLSEQKRIVSKIESIFTQIDASRKKLENVRKMLKQSRQAVLKQVFEGKLVSQDPNDEPAEVLLKKIHNDSTKELVFEKDNLPKGWITIILSDYININARIGWRGLKRNEYTDEGPLLLAVKDINENGSINYKNVMDHLSKFRYDESPEIKLYKKDILITKDGTIGKIGYVDNIAQPTTVNSSILVVRPVESIFPRCLFYYFKSPFFQKIVRKKIKGMSIPHLFQYDIKKFQLPIAPLPEQKRIVSKIESIFGRIDANATFAIHKITHKIIILSLLCAF